MDIDEISTRLANLIGHRCDKVDVAYALNHSGVWEYICEGAEARKRIAERKQKTREYVQKSRAKKKASHPKASASEAEEANRAEGEISAQGCGETMLSSLPPHPHPIRVNGDTPLPGGRGGRARTRSSYAKEHKCAAERKLSGKITGKLTGNLTENYDDWGLSPTPARRGPKPEEKYTSLAPYLNEPGTLDELLKSFPTLTREELVVILDGANAIFKAKVTQGRTLRGLKIWVNTFIANRLAHNAAYSAKYGK